MKKSICKVVAISIATDNREERQKGGEQRLNKKATERKEDRK